MNLSSALTVHRAGYFFEANASDSGFVLTHTDLNAKNVLVSVEGHLRGVIDWDGVVAMPHYVGCEQYPLWLTCDWNPWQYVYPDPHHPQHSPEEFAHHQSMYAEFMDLYLAHESKSSNQVKERTARADAYISTSSHFTRRSLLVQSLSLVSGEPLVTANFIHRIHRLVRKITVSEHGSFGLEDDMWNETSASKSGSSDLQDNLLNNVSGESSSAEAQSTTIEPYGSDEEETPGMVPS